MRQIFLGFLLVSILGSCEDSSNKADFIVDVSVIDFYSSEDITVGVQATSESKQSIATVEANGITFTNNSGYWFYTFPEDPGSIVITVTSDKGEVASAELESPLSIELPEITMVDRSEDLVVEWIGDPLAEEDYCWMTVGDRLGETAISRLLLEEDAPGTLTIPAYRLDFLSAVPDGVLRIDRVRATSSNAILSEGIGEIEYQFSQSIDVEIL